jgi:hypothetical protein
MKSTGKYNGMRSRSGSTELGNRTVEQRNVILIYSERGKGITTLLEGYNTIIQDSTKTTSQITFVGIQHLPL